MTDAVREARLTLFREAIDAARNEFGRLAENGISTPECRLGFDGLIRGLGILVDDAEARGIALDSWAAAVARAIESRIRVHSPAFRIAVKSYEREVAS